MRLIGGSERDDLARELAFWPWFWGTGIRSFWDRWLVLHVGIGLALALGVSGALSSIALTVFIPFASVLVGLAFAWGGNAMAVLQTDELHEIGNHPLKRDAYRDWVFSYQVAILVIVSVLVVWALAGVGLSDRLAQVVVCWRIPIRMTGRAAIFALSSIAVRECWSVVLGAQAMLLAKNRYRLEKEAAAKTAGGSGTSNT